MSSPPLCRSRCALIPPAPTTCPSPAHHRTLASHPTHRLPTAPPYHPPHALCLESRRHCLTSPLQPPLMFAAASPPLASTLPVSIIAPSPVPPLRYPASLKLLVPLPDLRVGWWGRKEQPPAGCWLVGASCAIGGRGLGIWWKN
jgi:hypothetical protein